MEQRQAMNKAKAAWKSQHVVELELSGDEIDIRRHGTKVYIRMTVATAQSVFDAMAGLAPTLQPFETLEIK